MAHLGRMAATMAHEAGHYLGLFHTTERRGTTRVVIISVRYDEPAEAD